MKTSFSCKLENGGKNRLLYNTVRKFCTRLLANEVELTFSRRLLYGDE